MKRFITTIAATAVAAAITVPALASDADKDRPGDQLDPAALIACLRTHGLNPPAAIDELKPWIAQQAGNAQTGAALSACGFNTTPTEKAPGEKKPGAPCGADVAEKARTRA